MAANKVNEQSPTSSLRIMKFGPCDFEGQVLSGATKICYWHVALSSGWFYVFLNAHAQNAG
jgi:hypothetical protein